MLILTPFVVQCRRRWTEVITSTRSARGGSLELTIGSVIGTHFHKRELMFGHFGGYFTMTASSRCKFEESEIGIKHRCCGSFEKSLTLALESYELPQAFPPLAQPPSVPDGVLLSMVVRYTHLTWMA